MARGVCDVGGQPGVISLFRLTPGRKREGEARKKLERKVVCSLHILYIYIIIQNIYIYILQNNTHQRTASEREMWKETNPRMREHKNEATKQNQSRKRV